MYPKTIVEQQQAYQVRVQEALSGEITALEFKAYSGGMGVYPRRGLKKSYVS